MKDIIERVFIMANIQKFVANNQRIFKKTLSYYIMHITVAMIVAYFVTGNLWMAVTLSLLEPTVQAFAFFFHLGEKEPYHRRKYCRLSLYIKRPLNSQKITSSDLFLFHSRPNNLLFILKIAIHIKLFYNLIILS
jgi:uncharacterized membrane protein